MKQRIKKITLKKERVILSDVLPFEIPITFSNRQFYRFLIRHSVQINENELRWKNNSSELKLIMGLIFGLKQDGNSTNKLTFPKDEKEYRTIPFKYKISHKENDFRELVIIHPINQLMLINFYDKYKELIIYYCSISPFSIRKPTKIAKFRYYKDRTHLKNLEQDHQHTSVEQFDKEYEHLKSFFRYKDFSNIYKFFESHLYHKCEKKYKNLFKFDISKCFDSIYTHSISWALLNKEMVKNTISSANPKILGQTFGGKFDSFMHNLNYGETNGIIIGPEFSRIFAELILQRIDFNVMQILKKEGLKFKEDYEIFRYIDDFFVFYNDENAKEKILRTYRLQLGEYKMYINDSKTMLFEKPIITGITIAKQKISDLLNEHLEFKVYEKINQTEGNEGTTEHKYSFYVSSNKLITRFKTIIAEATIDYKDILNYTLACVDNKINNFIKQHKNIHETKCIDSIKEFLEFTFFLYCTCPRVNTTIKLCLILSKIIKLVKKQCSNHENKHRIFKIIYDDLFAVLERNKNSEYSQIETLYLLVALKGLGQEYTLSKELLCKYFDINLNKKQFRHELNYFAISVLLFYIGKNNRFVDLKKLLEKHIFLKFKKVKNIRKMTELTILLMDLLSCPYLDEAFKIKLLQLYDIKKKSDQKAIIKRNDFGFTKWSGFNFTYELESKKSQNVY